MSKDNFVKGAAILSIAGLVVKILGAIYKIPLTNLITQEGIGYFQPAYNVYNLLLAMSLVGFPTAIARLVSEKRALNNHLGAQQIYSVSLWTLFVVGVVTSVLTLLLARPIVNLMGYPKSYYSLIALVPALLVIPILSAYRGFFQGTQNMVPIAISQILEQVFRVVVGLILAYSLVDYGIEKAAAGATFGASIGGIIALIVMFTFFMMRKKLTQNEIDSAVNNKLDTNKNVVNSILAIAIPITIGASIAPVIGVLDGAIVANRLDALGYLEKEIAVLYGHLSTAHTIINFPQAFSTAIAMSLVPVITEAFTKKDKARLNEISGAGIKISLILALPCGVGMFMLATPLVQLLFSIVGDELATTGLLLSILSISVIFLILVQAFTAILQSVNKQMVPVKNLFIGLIIKVILSFVLISIPTINIKGAALSTGGAYFVVAVLNYIDIKRYTTIKTDSIIKIAALPLLSTAIMAVAVGLTYYVGGLLITGKILTLLSVMVGGIVYSVALFATGTINSKDLELIPMGNKLKKFVRK
ncbi:polysaccharide biosynthesis protein [Sedimentibacter sp. zth1]|uniref:putative polysaccharide biosynthesis protein n=1 Tax=Sedimentibacter sp. zth1 TaxID=2816908 RepID=UPI001A9372FE|nr:polysaccharide biosynthesis protein [Sedimentibacter sp. zth1]QSX05057.1 polysaccharide biosynthesis protein [Sedimentibacter sp. zth1]